jgi:hypothetical protein
MSGGFSEQIEALATDRQQAFKKALMADKPLKPRRGGWTIGDVIFLASSLNVLLEEIGQTSADGKISEEEFRKPLRELTAAV